MNTFNDILDAPATEFVRPPAVPAGTYIALVKGLPERGKSTKKGTSFIAFKIAFIGVAADAEGNSDVDADALAEFGEIAGTEMNLTFYITEKSGYRCKEFLEEDLGIEIGDRSMWVAAQEAANHQLVVHVRQKPRDDGKGMYSEIASTGPIG